MTKIIEKLEKSITEENGMLQPRIDKIRAAIAEDQNVSNTFAERFVQAVQDGASDSHFEKLYAQRDETFKRIRQNEEVLNLLSTGNGSKVQSLKINVIKERKNEIKDLESKAAAIMNDLHRQKKTTLDGFEKIKAFREEIIEHKLRINSYKNDLNVADQEALGIPTGGIPTFQNMITGRNPLDQEMADLALGLLKSVLTQYEFNRLEIFIRNRCAGFGQ
ncbi:hypothetical protein [Paenibacillus sp. Soil750]|uniref:hypothetical protein n=1 Tax=Paenibacillus sp. Soil750 TaxID=1736398 RepID=UPI0012FB85F8|nr:hypothetical protein [Paenibacillus sp. Soil750]